MHVTRAANRLHIAQPALTQQIRLLEKQLGVALLRRVGRGIVLTESGFFFHKEAELILQQLHDVCLKTQEIARGNAGLIRVGVTEGAAFSPALAKVFKRYRAKWPSVQLSFVQRQATELATALRDRQIDAAFVCPIASVPSDFNRLDLARNRMLLAVPSNHPFAAKNRIALSELKDEPIILVTHGRVPDSFEGTLDAACAKCRFSPRIVQTSPELILALNLVAAGVGLTFVPDYMGKIRSDAICYLSIATSLPLEASLMLVTRGQESSSVVLNLQALAQRCCTARKKLARYDSEKLE